MGNSFEKQKNSMNREEPRAERAEDELQSSALPNSTLMRIMELPGAESEADRLSEGITSDSRRP